MMRRMASEKTHLDCVLLLAAATGLHSDPLSAQEAAKKVIAITGGRLLTVSHGTIENGVLVMADGKITAVGEAGKVAIPKRRADCGCAWNDGVSRAHRSRNEFWADRD